MTLNSDVLRCIFEHLPKRDQYTCTRVSREFCSIVIPFIWAAPFGMIGRRNRKVLKNYFLFVDNEEFLNMFVDNEKLLNNYKSLKSRSTPVFNYPSYLKELRLDEFLISLILFLKRFYERQYREIPLNKLIRALLDMFLTHQVKLKKISIRTALGSNINSNQYMIFGEQKYSSIFKSIDTLMITQQNFNIDLIKVLMDTGCQNIKNFEVWMPHYTDINTISKLISSQKGLARLRIFDCEKGIDQILPAIKSQAETLQDLELDVVNYDGCSPWTDLVACEKLKRLWITNSQHVIPNMVKPLYIASFPYLKDLNVGNPMYKNCGELVAWYTFRKGLEHGE
ncbi:1611_t:CDS:2 [Ambispora leptoticha]|uniref:1611_t:CDS:1 n=1 Tax=Ambispora leptoticha TaxID=144679 RepID=A0A9N9H161_9GLOM|nr:1611_t:CDS:2 [Ambispora leptoticha]